MGETADSGLRGTLMGGGFASYCLGILLIYALGASFDWDIAALCGIILPILGFIALCLVPESPAWLVRRKKIEKAKKALLWLRGGDMEQVEIRKPLLFRKHEQSLTNRTRIWRYDHVNQVNRTLIN